MSDEEGDATRDKQIKVVLLGDGTAGKVILQHDINKQDGKLIKFSVGLNSK